MSRPKSQETLDREREREIRRERRALKRQERERRRAERLERVTRRETIRNGGPVLVKPDPEAAPSYKSLRGYHPLQFCKKCREIKREDWMRTETICIACYEGGQSKDEEHKELSGASPAPGQGEKERAQPRRQARRQMQLEF